MANKIAALLSGSLLAAVALNLLIEPETYAQRSYGAGRGGYPMGTMSSSQYADSRYGGAGGRMGPWWWYGGAGAAATTYGGFGLGAGMGGGAGMGLGGGLGMGGGMGVMGSGMTDVSNQLLYPTADGPQPTTTPVPNYQTEAADNLATSHRVEHTDGPSMSFQDEMPQPPDGNSYFDGFWNDVSRSGASMNTSTQIASAPNGGRSASAQLAPPRVYSKLSPVQFNSKLVVRSELNPDLEQAEQSFMDLKEAGKLGTFDVEPLETQLLDLRRRAREIENIQNSVEQKAEEGRLINDIKEFEYQLRQHQ